MIRRKPTLVVCLCTWTLVCFGNAPTARAERKISGPKLGLLMNGIRYEQAKTKLDMLQQFEHFRFADEVRERRTYARLSERLRLAKLFINGLNREWTRAGFRKAVGEIETSPETAELFQASIPPLDADQFVSNSRIFQVLTTDGSLKQPPPVLVGEAGDSLETARMMTEKAWHEGLRRVGENTLTSYDEMLAMQEALELWNTLAQENLSRADWRSRHLGEDYLESVGLLMRAVEIPERREQLKNYYYRTGMGFGGGTVADLLDHVLTNRLSYRPGSHAQLILTELGHDMMRELDAQIELALKRVEYYKVQNKESGLDPELYGAILPEREKRSGAGRVSTSAERLKQILTNAASEQATWKDFAESERPEESPVRPSERTTARARF